MYIQASSSVLQHVGLHCCCRCMLVHCVERFTFTHYLLTVAAYM